MTQRPLFLHVGTGKSGTSSLQAALWNSTERLASAGVGMPFVGRAPSVRGVLRPLGWAPGNAFTRPLDAQALRQLGTRLRKTPGDVLLITNEDLAEAGPEQIDAFMDVASAAKVDLRIIVSARNWAKQIPSEYQQLLKHNLTATYEEFLDQVRHRRGVGAQFWRRQDVVGICERWGNRLDPADVHVISVPSFETDPQAVYRLFSDVVGFDHSLLQIRPGDVNAAYGVVEAELLRRLNVAFGDRLADYEKEYLPAVRRILIRFSIGRGASARIPLPVDHVDWVCAQGAERLEELRRRSYSLHGDPSLLVPSSDAGRPMPEFSDADLAQAAIATLANFTVRTFRQQQRAGTPTTQGKAGPRGAASQG